MHKNDQGASMQRKRICQEELSTLPTSKSLGRERSVSRSRDPSQNSRGNSSAQTDPFAYILAHQRDHRIGESNSDCRQKEFYARGEVESSWDRGHDYGKDRNRAGSAQWKRPRLSGVVAETLHHRIAAVTPRKEWTITRGARRIYGTRRASKIPRKDATNPLHIRLGNDQATVSVLKLMMIEQVYVRRHLMRRTGQTISCCLPPFLTLRITLAYLAYMSMCCLTQ